MPMPTPSQAALNWKNSMANVSQKMEAGVNAVTVSPTEVAAQNVDRMVQGIIKARDEGRIQAGLRSVSLPQWQQAMKSKGIPRVAQGAAAAIGKMQSFMDQFLPYLQSGLQQLQATPRGDLQQNIGRAVQMMQYNAQFKYRKPVGG